MPIEITVPRLGWSMEEGTFSSWVKREGEAVQAGDILFILESEKAAQEVESMDAGILRLPPDAPKPGDIVKVGQRLGYLLVSGEIAPWETAGTSSRPIPATPRAASSAAGDAPHNTTDLPSPPQESSKAGPVEPIVPAQPFSSSTRPAISPRAARLARDLGVDWTRLAGSGRTGRIRERDVRAFSQTPGPARGGVGAAGGASSSSSALEGSLSATRRMIADRMTASLRSTAPVTLTATADASVLVRSRNEWKVGTDQSMVPSYTELLIKICAVALEQHRELAGRWDGDRLVAATAFHIGVAVDTEFGLLVPVIRDVAALDLQQIATRARDLIQRARSRKLKTEELRGAVFTITTLGAFGIDAFTPIINYPECAILGVGQIRREPVAEGDAIVLRERVTLSLTFDHRAMDGAAAARFLKTFCDLVRSPASDATLEA